ncbi:MAG: Nif11-like leader peptide family natural product precursor [Cyanobacteria bacterium J06581_3]
MDSLPGKAQGLTYYLVNPELKQKLNASPNLDVFVETAQKNGYRFTAKEWLDATSFTVEELKGELSAIPGI